MLSDNDDSSSLREVCFDLGDTESVDSIDIDGHQPTIRSAEEREREHCIRFAADNMSLNSMNSNLSNSSNDSLADNDVGSSVAE